MLFSEGSLVYKLRYVWEELNLVKEAASRNSYLSLKPSVVTVEGPSGRIHVAVPQLSIITSEKLAGRDPDFVLAADAWIEAKKLVESSSVRIMGNGPLMEAVNALGLPTEGGGRECLLIDADAGIGLEEYLRLLNAKHVCILSGIMDVDKKVMEGELKHFWSSHPVLTGIESREELRVEGAGDITSVRKIKMLSKPLLFLGEDVLMAEYPYNNSIVFAGFGEELREFLVRVLLYVC